MEKELRERSYQGTSRHRNHSRRQISEGLKKYYNSAGRVTVGPGDPITPAKLEKFIAGMGGNPFTAQSSQLRQQLEQIRSGGGPAAQARGSMQRQARNAIRAAEDQQYEYERQQEKQQEEFRKLQEEYQSKLDEANAKNEERYNEGLRRLEDRRDRTMARFDNYGDARRAAIDEQYDETIGSAFARRASQGFKVDRRNIRSDTVPHAFRVRAERDKEMVLNDLEDKIADRKAAYDTRLEGDIVSFMERRTDKTPDWNQFLQLSQQYGLGNSGQGFDRGGGGGGGAQQMMQEAMAMQQQANAMPSQQDQLAALLQRSQAAAGGTAMGIRPMLGPKGGVSADRAREIQQGITGMYNNVVSPGAMLQYGASTVQNAMMPVGTRQLTYNGMDRQVNEPSQAQLDRVAWRKHQAAADRRDAKRRNETHNENRWWRKENQFPGL